MMELGILMILHAIPLLLFSAWAHNGIDDSVEEKPRDKKVRQTRESTDPDDYWDEGGAREYGATYSYGGARVRHPKNVDRAYAGSVERFHDGEW